MKDDSSEKNRMELIPVGVVRSEIRTPLLDDGEAGIELREQEEKTREHMEKVRRSVSEIVVSPEWAELLEGIERFSHVLVLYWPHLIDPERRNLRKVHPMGRKDLPVQGVFATCSPARPNPVLVSTVRLLGRDGNVLKVEGLDALDGSPVVDIKPYVRQYSWVRNPTVPEWMIEIHKELGIDILVKGTKILI